MRKTIDLFMCAMMGAKTNHDAPVDDRNAYDGRIIWRKCNRLGRTIGFPTANIQLYEPLKLLPGNGVYSVEAETLGRKFKGMCNIGVRPTVRAGGQRTIETNIFDFDEDIYGLDLKVTFHHKIRDERRFDSIDTLRSQLAADKASILAE